MSKRSKPLQDLLDLLEMHLAPAGGKVIPAKTLRDVRTGEDRAVDIVIEAKAGLLPVTVGIEVNQQKRKATRPWVESMLEKHRNLPVDKTCLVSVPGFFKPAVKKARASDIRILTVQQAAYIDWQAEIDSIPRLRFEPNINVDVVSAVLVFQSGASADELQRLDVRNIELHNADGRRVGSVKKVLDRFVASRRFLDRVQRTDDFDVNSILDASFRMKKGSYILDSEDRRHVLHSIRFRANCQKKLLDEKSWTRPYGDVSAVMEFGESFGCPTEVVFARSRLDSARPFPLKMAIRKKTEQQD